MGNEVRCSAELGGKRGEGRALLETSEIIFRGDLKIFIPLSDVKTVAIAGDDLVVTFSGKTARFTLGAAEAKKWAEKIRNPKGRLDKLGVKPGAAVAIVGELAADFDEELRARTGDVATKA